MGKTKIEWTRSDDGTPGRTWNPIRGCSLVSAGCTNCYAMKQAHRFSGKGQAYEGLTRLTSNGPVWTGDVRLVEEKLEEPLRWKSPRRIFVNSMSDLFHESLSDEAIDRVFAVMALCPQHTFQVLTKRAERMQKYLADSLTPLRIGHHRVLISRGAHVEREIIQWPFPGIWLGASVEDQKTAIERIPWLLKTPAAVRWVSYEPALGPVDFRQWVWPMRSDSFDKSNCFFESPDGFMHRVNERPGGLQAIGWIVCGGESGPGARPMHPRWAQSVRDQCVAAGVKFFFKQWGEHRPATQNESTLPKGWPNVKRSGPALHVFTTAHIDTPDIVVARVGKKAAGRVLDGRTWDEYPSS
jgi:protein gp37